MQRSIADQIGQVRGMKVRSSVKKMCEGCKVWDNSAVVGKGMANLYRALGGRVERRVRDMCISYAR